MVQRKAPEKSHGGLEKQLSPHLQQESKKKVKKPRPMAAQFMKPPSSSPIRNYMKPTSCSDARKQKHLVKKSPKCMEASGLKKKSSLIAFCPKKKVNRATCSSTLKDSRFPEPLELSHGGNEAEGTSKVKVCPYLYCSLNGHFHEPLPSIKSFISAKRKAMVIDRVSSSKTGKKVDKEMDDELAQKPSNFFVEIRDEDEISIQEVSNQGDDSRFSSDEMDENMTNFLEFVELDQERRSGEEYEQKKEAETEKSVLEAMDMDWKDEEKEEGLFPDDTEDLNFIEGKQANDSTQMNKRYDEIQSPRSRWKITRKMRTEELEEDDEFNPRPPRFLPMAADPESERVDLRHQMIDDRRNAEEWMIDYALRRMISNLGSDRKRKVALLVEAFETVVPLPVSGTAFSQSGSSAFPLVRSIQACS